VKALHDYVADRIAYDYPSFAAGAIPRSDVECGIRSGRAGKRSAAGTANLFLALPKSAGIEALTIDGQARSPLAAGGLARTRGTR